MNKRKEITANL